MLLHLDVRPFSSKHWSPRLQICRDPIQSVSDSESATKFECGDAGSRFAGMPASANPNEMFAVHASSTQCSQTTLINSDS